MNYDNAVAEAIMWQYKTHFGDIDLFTFANHLLAEFGGKVVNNAIEFPNEEAKLAFILRWAGS